jgi:uncharacterized protein
VTTFDLSRVKLRPGEQLRHELGVELEPLLLAGQQYLPVPALVAAELTVTKASSGSVLELAFPVRLHGPCFRCLADAVLELAIRSREYQAAKPGEDEELRSPYVVDDTLDLSSWARDALALELPDKILCRADCAGLCAICGKDLNLEPHVHEEERSDPRWAALEALRPESP